LVYLWSYRLPRTLYQRILGQGTTKVIDKLLDGLTEGPKIAKFHHTQDPTLDWWDGEYLCNPTGSLQQTGYILFTWRFLPHGYGGMDYGAGRTETKETVPT
jgi:hypothetical protein